MLLVQVIRGYWMTKFAATEFATDLSSEVKVTTSVLVPLMDDMHPGPAAYNDRTTAALLVKG
jgi:hypothetical protein